MKIKVLSESAIIQIASGEVIQRPLSIIKELVENAIDASADVIRIEMINGGCTLIKVSDNGCGILKDDLHLAFMRHATSKLENEDIHEIKFLGFRGEALASIAAVANVRIISRTQEYQGWEIKTKDTFRDKNYVISDKLRNSLDNKTKKGIFDDFLKEFEIFPSQHSVGTTVEVRDLFALTQNRLRFLKSPKYESSLCTDYIQNLSLAHPEVEFELCYDSKIVAKYHTYHKDDVVSGLHHRIREVLGEELIQNMVYIDNMDPHIRISGYVSVPTHNYSRSNKIFCFVNKRVVKDPFLTNAVRSAYFNLIPNGQFPAVVLFLEVPFHLVDVNIHPSKINVRFTKEEVIRETIVKSIRKALNRAGVSNRFGNEFLDRISKDIHSTNYNTPSTVTIYDNSISFDSIIPNKASDLSELRDNTREHDELVQYKERKVEQSEIKKDVIKAKYFEKLGNAVCQIGESYILAKKDGSLIIVDQHAAHERLVLEKLKKQFIYNNVITQKLVIPHIINLPFHKIDLLVDIKEELQKIGFAITRYDDRSLGVIALPVLLLDIDIHRLFENILENIDMYKNITISAIDGVLSNIACHYSIRSGRKMTLEEMNHMLREIEENDYTSQCNHGRPTYITLSIDVLSKLFERT